METVFAAVQRGCAYSGFLGVSGVLRRCAHGFERDERFDGLRTADVFPFWGLGCNRV